MKQNSNSTKKALLLEQNSKSTQTDLYDLKIQKNDKIIKCNIKINLLIHIICLLLILIIISFLIISRYINTIEYHVNSYIFVSLGQLTSFYIIKLLN